MILSRVLFVLIAGVLLVACGASRSGAEPVDVEAVEDKPVADEATSEEPTTEAEPVTAEAEQAVVAAAAADEGGCTEVPKDLPLAERCELAGAVVHTFPNGCVGKCRAMEEMMMCTQALTEGCKCPDGQCIDDRTGCCREIRH